jgi:hypothetical protein
MSRLDSLRRRLADLTGMSDRVARLEHRLDELAILEARTLIRDLDRARDIHDAEFSVFSQFGDDGILQYLVACVGVQAHERRFVEFGVENYREANTRFLLVNDNWSGLVIDGSPANVEEIRRDPIYWRHDLVAESAFIDRDNIAGLIARHGFDRDLGILSIDVDGNDFWIWKALDLTPPIIVVEYNSVFGRERAVTIPYDPGFVRSQAHPSHLFWGASLKALALLAQQKGYALVGSNSAGNNAYFVRNDLAGGLPSLTAHDAYVESKFRESRDDAGKMTYLRGTARLEAIEEMTVYDVETESLVSLAEVREAGRSADRNK